MTLTSKDFIDIFVKTAIQSSVIFIILVVVVTIVLYTESKSMKYSVKGGALFMLLSIITIIIGGVFCYIDYLIEIN